MAKKLTVLTKEQLDAQESLSLARLKALGLPKHNTDWVLRPKDSFVQLIEWVEKTFGHCLYFRSGFPASGEPVPEKEPLVRFIHNRIVIDGEFLTYCDENGIEVNCIHNDSIVSWKSDFGNEKFFMQGIFLIKKGDTKFLHTALLHKGNQNEDEVSFCVLTDAKNVEPYIALRNDFDIWSAKRDRSNLYVRVIGGEDIPYDKDTRWEDIFLPEDLKKDIRTFVEGFLKSKCVYEEKRIPWKKGTILSGSPGNGKTLLIKTIISNYDFKPVTVLSGANDDIIMEAFSYAQQQNPALLYFEDLDSLLENINLSLFLNLLDGISTHNGLLVIATANDISQLKANIKDRPSRFDRKFEIPLPDQMMTIKYLKHWFGSSIKDGEVKELATTTVKYGFSYAYLKELYISAIYNALGDDRKDITITDVKLALEQLLSHKFKHSKHIGIDKYLTKGKRAE